MGPISPHGKLSYNDVDTFSIGGWSVEFYRDDSGDIEGFMVNTGRARNVRYEKENN